MWKLRILIVALLMLPLVGCVPTRQDMAQITGQVDRLMLNIDVYQETVDQLAESDVIDKQKTEKIQAEIDKVQGDVIDVVEAVKEKADQGLVEQIRAGNEASRPFNPYADEVNAILGLVTVIGGIWAKGEHDKKKNAEAKRQADKQGRELALRQLAAMPVAEITAPIVKEKMYKAIGDARRGSGIT
ncbi:MAG: hypothetical protein ABIH91_01635 [Candidatus Omnitrophota bacterium]